MKEIFSKVKYRLIEKPYFYYTDYRLKKNGIHKKSFSLISNNCFGGDIYKSLNIPYKTPIAGLFIPIPDYIKFLKGFEYYRDIPVIQIFKSKYPYKVDYPLGLLDNEIEIHFLHYTSFEEAVQKWSRRYQRVHFDNLYIIMFERDYCKAEHIKLFDQLSYKNKVCFTANSYALKSVVKLAGYDKELPGADIVKFNALLSYDIVKFLNQ